MFRYYLLMYLSVSLGACGQILFKLGAVRPSRFAIFGVGPYLMLGMGVMVISMLLSVRAFSVVPLSDYVFILPTGYVLVAFLSWMVLKEKFTKRIAFGTLLIVLGAACFQIPSATIF